MRLVIDMQSAQTESRFRGIGRYTLSLVREMARQRGEHEILLVLNAAFADTIEAIRAEFTDLLSADAIHVFEVAGPITGINPADDARRKAAEQMYEAFLITLRPDLIFIPSLFEGAEEDAVTSLHGLQQTIPCVAVLFDLIPLIYRQIYISTNPAVERWYIDKLNNLRRADLLLSISKSSMQEAINYLNFPEFSLVNISGACDPQFRSINLNETSNSYLKNHYNINRSFVMYAGGIDKRKNVDGLFRAFANLKIELRKAHLLVLVGREVKNQKSHFIELAKTAGLHEDELVFTGYVCDSELNLLYNACTLFVFPSWHEGFGLPALEAMACGKAVIAANSSSLPEVVGRDDALFASRDDAAMTAKMAEVLGNAAFRQELERHGLEQAKKFSWTKSSRRAWTALENLHAQSASVGNAVHPRLSRRRKLALVSDFPQQKTGIVDYPTELLPELARYYDITVIVQQESVGDAWVQANAPIRDASWFRAHAQHFERVVYLFGNNQFQGHLFNLLDSIPGMVVLHDFYLADAMLQLDVHGKQRYALARTLHASHGWKAVRELFQGRDADVVGSYPCNLPVLQQALGIIVHSNFSRALARQFYGEQAADNWSVIPHLRHPAPQQDKALARQSLGLPADAFVVCSFSLLGTNKLNHRVLDAWLASTLATEPRCRLVFVGKNHDGELGQTIEQAIAKNTANDRIVITDWASTEAFRDWLSAADVAVQLRTHSRAETSAALLDCMNYGLPTIVNAHGSMAELSRDSVWMLPDNFSDSQLIDALTTLWKNEAKRINLSTHARAEIRSQHNPRICASRYSEEIEKVYSEIFLKPSKLLESAYNQDNEYHFSDAVKFSEVLANNFPQSPRLKKILLDISVLVVEDAKTGIQRVVRSLLSEIILNPPKGWIAYPIYMPQSQEKFHYANKFSARFLGLPDDWIKDEPIQIYQEDIYISLDLNHHILNVSKIILERYRQRGLKIYAVVYDILPVLMPTVFPKNIEKLHQQWLKVITKFDGALCISRAVADELYDWLQTFGEKRDRPFAINWFNLGSDVDNSNPTLGLPDDAQQTLYSLAERPTFLMVGTIEPRKGHAQTLAAFEALWADDLDVNLVIVGKRGWNVDALTKNMREHPEFGKRMFWLEGISDEYLERIYAASTCLIAASFGEGFGLPLIEAARHSLPLVVRDIPVFREVTDGQAHFFSDSREPDVIAEAVREWLSLYQQDKHPRSDSLPHITWAESARNVLDIALGSTPPYLTWLPDGVCRYWGADPRLHTEVGESKGRSIYTTGKAGRLIFGPNAAFVAGIYRIIVKGNAEHWTQSEQLRIVCANVQSPLFTFVPKNELLGSWRWEGEFVLDKPCHDLDIQIWVDQETCLCIQGLEIEMAKEIEIMSDCLLLEN